MSMPTRNGFVRTEQDAINDAEAVRLRSLGWSYQRIANELGISKSTAYERVQRALVAIPSEAVDEYRQIQRAQMDDLMATYLPQALAGDVKSADLVLKLLDRRAKLEGTDAPTKTEVITLDAIDAEIRRLETQLGENDVAGTRTAGETTQA
jgi:predicted transcriptional regulator